MEQLAEDSATPAVLTPARIRPRLDLVFRFDLLDIRILSKFYSTGMEFPNDTCDYVFPILLDELSNEGFKVSRSALEKRLRNLVKFQLLAPIEHTNPRIYQARDDRIEEVRAIIHAYVHMIGAEKISENFPKK